MCLVRHWYSVIHDKSFVRDKNIFTGIKRHVATSYCEPSELTHSQARLILTRIALCYASVIIVSCRSVCKLNRSCSYYLKLVSVWRGRISVTETIKKIIPEIDKLPLFLSIISEKFRGDNGLLTS